MARSFQWRLMLMLLGLVSVVQIATFLAVNYTIHRNVLDQANRELDVGAKVFSRLLANRGAQLRETVQLAASDFGFREAAATGDADTVQSVLVNHSGRINASFAAMLALDGKVLASTTDAINAGAAFPAPELLARARLDSLATGVSALGTHPFQIVLAEVKAPQRIGWVSMGFALDEATLSEFRDLSGLQISLAVIPRDGRPSVYSTLPATAKQNLQDELATQKDVGVDTHLDQPDFLTRVVALGNRSDGGAAVLAVLQASASQALQPYDVLKKHLVFISLTSLLMSIFGAWLLARGVTLPVRKLVLAARRVGRGEYHDPVNIERSDELGELAKVFNHMQSGISDREKQIAHQAFHDGLTGLPNRASVEQQLGVAIAQATRDSKHVAVLMLDVNRFKEINDTLGHPTGDRLLIGLGQRLSESVRASDVVARLGGDEFLVMLHNVDLEGAKIVADKLVLAAAQSMHLEEMDIHPDVSVGVAVFPEHGATAADIIRRADIAMYDAKQNRISVSLYQDGRDASYIRRFSLINEIRRAVSKDELRVHYQPKMKIGTHMPSHVEALVRWQHPIEGLLPPDQFIPLAEHAGSIHLITDWMLRHVIRQCREWADAGIDLGVAVNLSALDLAVGTLPASITGYLEEFGVPADRLLLEITESTIMRDAGYALDLLQRLKSCGVQLAIDDFGTGYSSLAHLKRLPVDEIKIDKSFVMSMTQDSDDAVIVRSTIELGHNMGLSVVAEGVEDDEALGMLEQFNCDMVQGYLISRPLPANEITQWLTQRHATPTRCSELPRRTPA